MMEEVTNEDEAKTNKKQKSRKDNHVANSVRGLERDRECDHC